MALDFPSSPTNGQVYGNFVYSTAKGAWQAKPITGKVTTSATAPSTPSNGDEWFNTNDGNLYVYYNDGDTSQWVQVKSDATLSSTIGNRVTTLETYPSGLVPIIPTSITVGGTGSVAANGVVTFTATGAISLNGIFSSAYTEYKIFGRWVADADRGYAWRWRANGVDKTDAYYHHMQIWSGGAGVVTSSSQNATYHGYSLGHRFVSFEGTFTGGAQNTLTKTMAATYNGLNSATTQNEVHIANGFMRESAYVADGLTMFCSSGNVTGQLQVFGVRR